MKEKVIRIIVATFRVSPLNLSRISCGLIYAQNLVTKAPKENLPAMLVSQVLPFVKNLASRKWSDEDILEDVQFLKDELNARFQSLTHVNCHDV